jgi:hypothetical protein
MSRKRQRIVPREVSKKDSLVQHSPEQDIERPDGEESLQETLHFDEYRGDTRDPEQAALTGGDVDAAANRVDAGEEVVGGDNPTPDQDIVDELGKSAGVTYEDTEPLLFDKLEGRDRDRWELDPASSEDYQERQKIQSDAGRRQSKKTAGQRTERRRAG